jgi:hypothetical protein
MPSASGNRPDPRGGRFGHGGLYNARYRRAMADYNRVANAGVYTCQACDFYDKHIAPYKAMKKLSRQGQGPAPPKQPPRCNRGHHAMCPKSERYKEVHVPNLSVPYKNTAHACKLTFLYVHVCLHSASRENVNALFLHHNSISHQNCMQAVSAGHQMPALQRHCRHAFKSDATMSMVRTFAFLVCVYSHAHARIHGPRSHSQFCTFIHMIQMHGLFLKYACVCVYYTCECT